MRSIVRLHRHQTGLQSVYELRQLRTRHAPSKNHSAAAIQRSDTAAALPQINSDNRNGRRSLLFFSMSLQPDGLEAALKAA